MGLRLLRICSSEAMFENRLQELKDDFLVPRNYKPRIIDTKFKKLPGTSYDERRREALKKLNKL